MIDINVHAITELQRETVVRWHDEQIGNPYDGFLAAVCRQHEQNFRLWHQEDLARSRDVSEAMLAEVKRQIDRLNQCRNDLIEELDVLLLEELAAAGVTSAPGARLNTETPGSVIDRLSILALRIYHMEEQAARPDADASHRHQAHDRLEILRQQHCDLSTSLAELLEDIFAGQRLLKVYRQMKMYNDPTLNPYLHGVERNRAA
ncbi:MAG: DUF4254 domain-containing protein [Pirellulales bacterium]|nr:DUF4254 domain-containing protein [Pirellulales bacterium]